MQVADGSFEALLDCIAGRPNCSNDWFAILALANAHQIAPALSQTLRRNGQTPSDVIEYVDFLANATERRNRRLLSQLSDAASALNAREIVPLVLKGAALLLTSPIFVPTRRMDDFDLLVRHHDVEVSRIALADAGYRMLGETNDGMHALFDLGKAGGNRGH